MRLGFLTEGTLGAQGAAAEGIETALHYGDGIDNPKNIAFRTAFKDKAGRDADVYAVQGYDAAQLLAVGLEAVKGKIEDEANLYKAMRAAKIDSPRGPISFSPSQNVVQNIYLRKRRGRPEQGGRHRPPRPRRPRHRLQAREAERRRADRRVARCVRRPPTDLPPDHLTAHHAARTRHDHRRLSLASSSTACSTACCCS